MNKEKMEAISAVLMANKDEIGAIMDMEPAQAAAVITEKGCPVTEAELVEFAKCMDEIKKNATNDGELDENALEDVAGGGLVTAALVGVAIGYWVYGQKW